MQATEKPQPVGWEVGKTSAGAANSRESQPGPLHSAAEMRISGLTRLPRLGNPLRVCLCTDTLNVCFT